MQPGDVISGRFEALGLAGSGGMGAVYRARDRVSGVHVAVKVLRGGQEARDSERFSREAVMLAELSHPGIVRYVAHGSTPAAELYIAMEWLDGVVLSDRLERGGVSADDALIIVSRAAEALGAAHARGIVHRDVKPSNLFLVGGDPARVKVLDFGVARPGHAAATETRSGVVLGTPAYMAPEQARGERTVDARADVFALGCVLFECLTGRVAFAGEHLMAVLAKILLEEAPRLGEIVPDAPAPLEDLVARMLAKDPDQRPADGAAVAQEIAALGPLKAAARPPVSAPASGLTSAEQRILSVLMIEERSEGAGAAPTLAADEAAGAMRSVALAASAHGARLELLAGGAMVVLLSGTSAAHDQAERAARCALALSAMVPDAPMALATGRGRLAGRVLVGEVIDRATRLVRAAGADPEPERVVRLDEVTAGLLDRRFDVRGDRAGLYLRGERQSAEVARRLLGRAIPCVGRERELGVLLGMLDHCVREPVAQAALVVGDAGIGKSRLLEELRRELGSRAAARPIEIWTARGDPLGAGSPYSIAAQLLRGAAGVLDGEALPVRRQRLRARLGRHLAPGELPRVSRFLGELVGAPFPDDDSAELRAARRDPVLMGDQMRRAFEDLLAAECAAAPLLVVVEDLHQGDLPSTKLLDGALRQLADRPLMIAGFARPEVHSLFPRLWRERGVQEIRLDGLTRGACRRLVQAAVGDGLAAPVVDRLVERAAGNPFYLEELVRAAAAGNTEAFPETVVAMVQARLDATEPEARRVLRAASVFGHVFWARGAQALLGSSRKASEVTAWLEELERREVISARGEGRFPGHEDYAFRHPLVREAAYGLLTEEDRRLGHRLAGAWLEEAGETDALVLAEHFERGGSPERAVGWYHRAAEQALGANDLESAIDRAGRARTAGAAGEVLGALLLVEAEARSWRGDLKTAAASATRALELLPRADPLWYRAAALAASSASTLGEDEPAVALAGELAMEAPLAGAQAEAFYTAASRLAMRLLYAGKLEPAERLLARVDDGAVLASDPVTIGWIERALAARAKFRGDPAAYLERALRAERSFRRGGDLRSACAQGVALGYALIEIGAHADAKRALDESLAGAERMGLALVTAQARQNLGLALARLGDAEAGALALGRAIEAFSEQGNRRMEAASRVYLAHVLNLAGAHGDAEQHARAAAAVALPSRSIRAQALSALAESLLGLSRSAEALEAAREAMALIASLGGVEEGDCHIRLIHAEALHASGEVAGARDAVHAARALLLARAAKIEPAERRRTFLEAIPENARTLARAGEWA